MSFVRVCYRLRSSFNEISLMIPIKDYQELPRSIFRLVEGENV